MTFENRPVWKRWNSKETVEGAGVKLRRAFGFFEKTLTDPFLLLDDFRSDTEKDFIAGFPWHPHRGIETVTYMLAGNMEHQDSLGSKGVVGPDEIQWMTAGSGIVHTEMPHSEKGVLGGFQLWVNLPKDHKMMNPRYQDIRAGGIVEVPLSGIGKMRVIAGGFDKWVGPVQDLITHVHYLDISLDPHAVIDIPARKGYTTIAYVIGGCGRFSPRDREMCCDHTVVLFGDGDVATIEAGELGARFLFLSGKPIRETVAWYGPIVMNTEEEIRQAFNEYENGTFVKGR
jgi:hypothetical protein